MESRKSLTKAKSEFVDALLETVSTLPREAAEQRLCTVITDIWNYCENQVRQMPVRPKAK